MELTIKTRLLGLTISGLVFVAGVSATGYWGITSVHKTTAEVAATGSADKTVKIWNPKDGANIATLVGAKDWIYAVSLSPNGSQVAAGCWDGSLLIWTIGDSKLQKRVFMSQ